MFPFSDKQYTAAIDFADSGDNEIIAAPSAGRIAVDHIHFIPEAAATLIIKNGNTNLEGPENFDPQQAKTMENVTQNYEGIYTCSPETALNINSDGTVQVSGYVRYRIIDAY